MTKTKPRICWEKKRRTIIITKAITEHEKRSNEASYGDCVIILVIPLISMPMKMLLSHSVNVIKKNEVFETIFVVWNFK